MWDLCELSRVFPSKVITVRNVVYAIPRGIARETQAPGPNLAGLVDPASSESGVFGVWTILTNVEHPTVTVAMRPSVRTAGCELVDCGRIIFASRAREDSPPP